MAAATSSADAYDFKYLMKDGCTLQVWSTIGCCACLAVTALAIGSYALYLFTKSEKPDEKQQSKNATTLAFVIAFVCATTAVLFYRNRASRFACVTSYFLFGNPVGGMLGRTSFHTFDALSSVI